MDFSKLDGLIPAVVQDDRSGEVLMVGFMNEEALTVTRTTGFATFFSRSRGKLWTKGETSGNRLQVRRILKDCDEDTVLLRVTRLGDGNVCHTGERSCFFREIDDGNVAASFKQAAREDKTECAARFEDSACRKGRCRTPRSSSSRAPDSTSTRARARTSRPSTIPRSSAC